MIIDAEDAAYAAGFRDTFYKNYVGAGIPDSVREIRDLLMQECHIEKEFNL